MKAYIKMLGVLAIAYVITTMAINILGNWHNYEEKLLDNNISVEIIRTDGKIEQYENNKFPMLNRGDKLTAVINIPPEYDVENPALCFHVYNCEISLAFEGEVFYRYGEDLVNSGAHIGTVYAEVIIPEEAIGKSVVLECLANENQAMNQLTDVTIMEATESAKAGVVNNLFELLMFITIALISGMALLILLFSDVRDKMVRMGIWIALFSLLLSFYILSSRGLLNVLNNNPRATANLEYISLFALPISFGAYFCELYSNSRVKKLLGIIEAFYIVFFVICTVLNYTTVNYHYCRFLLPMHIAMAIGILVYVGLPFVKIEGMEVEQWSIVIRNGVVAVVAVGLIDLLLFNFNQYSDSIVFKFSLLPMGMIIMIASLLMGTMMQLLNRYKEKEEKRQLERLAYIDIMTGIANRAKCYEYINEMKADNAQEYTIIYIDLNNLKFVNDQYGHEQGDQYIKLTASAMQKCFQDADIISRFGGDEFVVLYNRKCTEDAETLVKRFQSEGELLNKENNLPFRIQAACGAIVSTKEAPLKIEEAIIMADKLMYENKKQMKEKEVAE